MVLRSLQVISVFIAVAISQQLCALAAPGNLGASLTNDYNSNKLQESTCVDTETGRELYVGEDFERPGRCIHVQCLGTLTIWEDRCQHPKLNGNCTEMPAANEFLQYPRCCPLYECVTFQWNEYGKAIETRTFDHLGTQRKTDIVQEFFVSKQRRVPDNSRKPHVKI